MRNTMRELKIDEMESVGGGGLPVAGTVPFTVPGFQPATSSNSRNCCDVTIVSGMAAGGGSGRPMHAPLQA